MENFDLAAARWRQSDSDNSTFLHVLAVRLLQALPSLVEINYHPTLFSSKKKLKMLTVNLTDLQFILHVSKNGSVETQISTVVRGIRLKSEECSFDTWLQRLSTEINIFSQQHTQMRETLEKFLLGAE